MEAKRTIRKLFIFLAPLIILFIFTEYRLAGFHDTYLRKVEYFNRCKDSIRVLFFGTSQVAFDINPTFISVKSYNVAEPSQSLYYDKQVFLKYITQMPRLKLITIDIEYFSLYYDLKSSPEEWRELFYERFWGIHSKNVSIWDSRLYSYWELYTPYTVMAHFRNIFFQKIIPDFNVTSNGYIRNDTNGDEKLRGDSNAMETLKTHESLMEMSDCKMICADLDEMIKAAQKRNIRVVLVSTPVLPYYYEHRNQIFVGKTDSIMKSLCNEYHLSYFNYVKDSRFSPRDFTDAVHMNFIGAEKFSSIINKEIIKPLCSE